VLREDDVGAAKAPRRSIGVKVCATLHFGTSVSIRGAYRALAEGLRIQSCWRRAGIAASADHEFAHDNFLQKQNIELGWIRNVMRAASLYPSTHPERQVEHSKH
jgi:hypothetical protein